MQKGTNEVKSGGEVVGEASYDIFDALNEAVENLGEPECVKLINAQIRTNALNEVRSVATGKPSKARIKDLAIDELCKEDYDLAAENAESQGISLGVALKSILAEKEAEIRERHGIVD